MLELVDWAPNSHALVVHLPIGLLVAATMIDLLTWLQRNDTHTRSVATGFYVAGVIAVLGTYLTGRSAAAEVYTPGLALPVVARHWDWALGCVLFYGALGAARVVQTFAIRSPGRLTRAALTVAGLMGVGLLAVTGELGGRLVYEHGVGVSTPSVVAPTPTR